MHFASNKIRVVEGADPYNPLSAMKRVSIIGFPSRGRLTDLSLSVLDLHQAIFERTILPCHPERNEVESNAERDAKHRDL